MTATEFWSKLDELATSKDTSNALLEMAHLLREAGEPPLLILCRRTPGRIHHLYTVFDERNPDATMRSEAWQLTSYYPILKGASP